MVIRFILWPLAGFLIGGIPSGLLIGRLFGGPDLRESGSQNIGATNAYRVLGVLPGLLTLLQGRQVGPVVWIGTSAPGNAVRGPEALPRAKGPTAWVPTPRRAPPSAAAHVRSTGHASNADGPCPRPGPSRARPSSAPR